MISYAGQGLYPAAWAALLLEEDGLEPGAVRSLHRILLPLLQGLKWKGSPQQLAEILGGMPRAIGLQELRNILAELGYGSRLRHGKIGRIYPGALPFVFLPVDEKEPPLLLIEEEGAIVARNALTRAAVPLPLEEAKGTRVLPEPIEMLEHAPPPNQWFSYALRRFRPLFRQVLFLGLLINGLSLAVPFFSMMVYDHVIGVRDLAVLFYLIFGVALAFTAEAMFRLIRASALSWFGARINFLAAQAVFERLLAIEPLLVEQASPAAQVARIKTFESVREFFSGQAFLLFIEMPFLLVLLLALACLSLTMAVACVAVGVVFGLLAATQLRSVRLASQRSARALSERQRDALEIVTKLRILRLNGMEGRLLNRLLGTTRKSLRRATDVTHRMKLVEHLATSLTLLGGLLAISFGVQDVWALKLTPGGLIAGMILVWRILTPLQQIATVAPRLEQVQGGIQQIERLLQLPIERSTGNPLSRPYEFKGQVELVNLAIRYPKQLDPVFSGLNVSIKPGQFFVIAGGNGSGKSSLLKLLNGLYRPAAGTIRLDGVDLRQFDPLALRRSVTYVSQTADLFSGTVRENLTLAAPFVGEEAIRKALMDAGAFEAVMALPAGLETHIGSDGVELPPMLAYTLSLARAYLSLKKIVLLDELPYAILASDAGHHYRATVERLKGKHTIVAVSHTADLVELADGVIYLQQEQRPRLMAPGEAIHQLRELRHGV